METYADTTRIVATCNNRQKVIEPLRSRFQEFQFTVLDKEEFFARVLHVLDSEAVDIGDGTLLDTYTARAYPDLRKCLNSMQLQTVAGVLQAPSQAQDDTKDYLLEFVTLWSEGRFLQARKLIIAQAVLEDYEDIYRYFYRNLDLFGDTPRQHDDALLILKRAVVNRATVGDQEILLAATMVELNRVAQA